MAGGVVSNDRWPRPPLHMQVLRNAALYGRAIALVCLAIDAGVCVIALSSDLRNILGIETDNPGTTFFIVNAILVAFGLGLFFGCRALARKIYLH